MNQLRLTSSDPEDDYSSRGLRFEALPYTF